MQAIQPKRYQERRARFMQQMVPNSVALFFANGECQRNADVNYPFRQNSDFYYLTGYHEADAVLLLVPGRAAGASILFNLEKDKTAELWTGTRVGQVAAVEDFGVDEAYPLHALTSEIIPLLQDKSHVYYQLNHNASHDQQVKQWLNTLRPIRRNDILTAHTLIAPEIILDDMRVIKDDYELDCMQQAADISAQAFRHAFQETRPGVMEYQIEASMMHTFLSHSRSVPAYPMIIAGGQNACILHYTENNSKLVEGELLLIDAGAEYQNYAADITRTFPINGRFNAAQQALYELVLAAQLAGIACAKPNTPWTVIQTTMVEIMTQGLVDLGLLQGDVATLIAEKAYFKFYMHGSGHWLGLDVHDVGHYKNAGEPRVLVPGMVFTIEPGLYINPNCLEVAEKWRGMGIRIEDDIVITASSHHVLSHKVPKSVDEIHAVMRSLK